MVNMPNYKTKMIWLIVVSAAFRLILSVTTDLGNVEVYYWSWSQKPQWNYFDHPPIVAWMIGLTTLNKHFVNELTVRLGCIIAGAICTWLTYQIGKLLKDEQTGWFAAILYNACLYTGVLTSAYVLPDSPQLVFWFAALLVALKIITVPDKSVTNKQWLWFGLLCGVSVLCKVHGVFLWAGTIIYLLVNDRSQFKNPFLYLAVLVSLIVISPILVWNIQHHWITWHFQSNRVTVGGQAINLLRFAKQFMAVVFVVGPIVFYLIWRSVFTFYRKQSGLLKKQLLLILCCSLPLIVLLLFVSIFREVYAHWACPAYATLLLLPALQLSNQARPMRVLTWALVYTFLVAVAAPLIINYFPGTTSAQKEGLTTGAGDETVDMLGWQDAGEQFAKLYHDDVKKGLIKANAPVLISAWTPGAATEFYLAHQTGQEVLGIGSIDSLHQYYLTNAYKQPLKAGDDAYYIFVSNHFDKRMADFLPAHFKTADNALTVPVYRNHVLCKQFYIFRLNGYQ